MSSSWLCRTCTFLNPPSQKSRCQVCLSPNSSPSSASDPRWTCRACTFSNPFENKACEICATRHLGPSLASVEDFIDSRSDSDPDRSVGAVFLPLQRCKRKEMDVGSSESVKSKPQGISEKRCKRDEADPITVEDAGSESLGIYGPKPVKISTSEEGASSVSLKILTYNVWFREDLELRNRMRAVGQIVLQHSPDVICFQEVTPDIYNIFNRTSWWKRYRCSISKEAADPRAYFCMLLSKLPVTYFKFKPFGNSIMGRELCTAEIEIGGHKPLVIATSHLESPCPAPPRWDQMFTKQRVAQAEEALDILKSNPNVIFGGDMNWDDKRDGPFPLPDKWVDAWKELRSGEDGFTYDTKTNPMLKGNRSLRLRLDRFLCCLGDYKISGIEMVGKESIPELSYVKEKKVRNEIKEIELPVLPSDHYGLLLTIGSH